MMKKFNIKSLLKSFLTCALVISIIGCSNTDDDASDTMTETTVITLDNTFDSVADIYVVETQQNIENQIEALKSENNYTDDNMLAIYNPYGTNTLSMYIYFNTETPVTVSYNIHVDDSDINDFERVLTDEYTTEHEYQLIGLVPDQENTVTMTLTDEEGTSYNKSYTYTMGSLIGDEQIQLEKTEGESEESLEDGLYVVFGYISGSNRYMFYYDNDGVIRGELPLVNYRSDRLLFDNDSMYFNVSYTQMVEMNNLGQVTQVYDLGNYKMHHDYVFDNDGNILILATDTTQDTIEDTIIRLNLTTGDVDELLDLGDVFTDLRDNSETNSSGDYDWIHVNTIQYLDDDSVIISSRETSSIIKFNNISTAPSLDYIISDESIWEGTEFASYVLEKDGEFASQTGQHTVTYIEDDSLEEGQYYLEMFNNNYGISQSRPDFDWSVIDGIVLSSPIEGTCSYYYKYLVDENTGTYSLVDSLAVEYSGYVSSVQEIGDNLIVDSGIAGNMYEYDSNHELIASFYIEVQEFSQIRNYRVYKHTFEGFYFN